MIVKDIVNRDLVNLTNCDQEPIHIPGSIQGHGFLLGLKMADLTIDFCSGNSLAFTNLTYHELLTKSPEVVFGKAQTDSLMNYINSPECSSLAPLEVELKGKRYTCTAQLNAAIYILEIEPAGTEKIAIADVYQQTKQFTAFMQEATTMRSLCQLVADETRSIIGFDRVMIYRFDEDYNGEVFAESRTEMVEPFLGLHYPHTDIPAQARDLFIKNFIRLIPDVNYVPVPIYTVDDARDKNIDLTISSLRSVSPIHIRYLKNMGVGATLTISLIHESRLWGLIACHHYSPKYLTTGTRIAAKLQGHFLASQISVREAAEEYSMAKKVNKSLDKLLIQIFSPNHSRLRRLVQGQDLLSLTNAAGVILVVSGEIHIQGIVPPAGEIGKLIDWLARQSPPAGFSTTNLSKLYPDASNWCGSASGIIFHQLGPGNCIIWCRVEALQEVNWAGNPDKAVIKDGNGLSPRQSFALWKETKKCESNQWQKPELVGAISFSNALQQHLNMLLQKQNIRKKREAEELILANKVLVFQNEEKEKAAIRLIDTNRELEQITYIASHDLQEPLRTIANYIKVFEEDYAPSLDETAFSYMRSISSAALRMSLLINSLLDFSRLGINKSYTFVDLGDLVNDVREDLKAVITTSDTVIEIADMPKLYIYETEIRQVFQNLIANAIKFRAQGTRIVIKIGAERMGDKWKFSVRDNGIGIDPIYAGRIFDMFQRLHSSSKYEGHGIGLAYCKKIIEMHQGRIWVESNLGNGANFIFTLPENRLV
jgi:chemotaxis family two-component system sensor kinase Cph1